MTLQMPADMKGLLGSARNVVITAHERPDGDALGSSLGLRRILAAHGVNARVVGVLPIPPRYEFLLTEGEIEIPGPDWARNADILFALDCGALDRLGDFINQRPSSMKLVNIDHHDSNALFGDLNWVDPAASSVGEMIIRFADEVGFEIPLSAAEALWVAIVTDTGRFSYENTSADVLRLAAELLDRGVDPARVAGHVYQSVPEKELRLSQRALSSLRLSEGGRVAAVVLTEDDFRSCDCGPENAQDIVDIPRRLDGVELGFFCYELPGENRTKISARSVPPYDVADLCRSFGGGGHRRAAGCSIDGPAGDALSRVLSRVHERWYLNDSHTE